MKVYYCLSVIFFRKVITCACHLPQAFMGSLDPRYSVLDGRRTPDFYVAEVERGRELILTYAIEKLEDVQRTGKGSSIESIDTTIELLRGMNISYCHYSRDNKGNIIRPTLAQMSISPHGKDGPFQRFFSS